MAQQGSDYASEMAGGGSGGGAENPKVYAAHFTQSGTDAPTVTILKNTIGNIVWSYTGDAGRYYGELAGAFPDGKLALVSGFTSVGESPAVYFIARSSDDVVQILSLNAPGDALTDGLLNNTFIKIEVYL